MIKLLFLVEFSFICGSKFCAAFQKGLITSIYWNNEFYTRNLESSSKFRDHYVSLGKQNDESFSHAPCFYNTATKKKEPFYPIDRNKVSFYSCGPTIYDNAHIGNFRAFLTYDILKKWLLYRGYEVVHVCNLTDVDDKIIKRMRRENTSLKTLTDKYAKEFFEDIAALNIMPATFYPRATEHIDDIVTMIKILIDKGYAYSMEGSVYFRISSFDSYGSLSSLDFHISKEHNVSHNPTLQNDSDEYEKENVRDFALWKAYKEEDGDVFWETILGKGRPGWHIECSAMALKYLGKTIDIHAGGIDLVFPHHENEIAQTEGFTGNKFCNCWIHNGFVNISGEKMSKSKGNFLTLKSTFKSSDDIRAFRFLVVTSHYRTPLNFTETTLNGAQNAIKRLDKAMEILKHEYKKSFEDESICNHIVEQIHSCLKEFENGMNDDMNTPRAVAGLFSLVKLIEKISRSNGMNEYLREKFEVALNKMDQVFGVFYCPSNYFPGSSYQTNDLVLSSDILELLEKRKVAKKEKRWDDADSIRRELNEKGYIVKDIADGKVEVIREA